MLPVLEEDFSNNCFKKNLLLFCLCVCVYIYIYIYRERERESWYNCWYNASFIALIPKTLGAIDLMDFRPISLVSGVYEIIVKVLANRMSRAMEKIISKPHNAFVKSRQILGSVLIASKCLDSHIKPCVLGVLCKLDITKAFDHINWKFLLYMLRRCSFGEKWVSWIARYISLVCFSILVNGSPFGFFSSSCGLRHSDPLSLLLFVVVKEALNKMFYVSVERLRLSGFSVGSRLHVVNISHMFVNDTLVFCEANPSHLRYLHVLLLCFEVVSSLKVNLAKSVLVPMGTWIMLLSWLTSWAARLPLCP